MRRSKSRRQKLDHSEHFVALLVVLGLLVVAVLAGIVASTLDGPLVIPRAMRMVAPVRTPTVASVVTVVPTSQTVTVFDVVLSPAE